MGFGLSAPGGRTGVLFASAETEEVPTVALEIQKDCDLAVRLNTRR
jgi:hypothetical protein